jgi:hypothetical protein
LREKNGRTRAIDKLVRFHFEWVNTQNMEIIEYPISNLEQQSRNQFCNHGTHGTHGKRLTTKHTNHTKKTIVNFLLRKNLTIDFVKNVQKKQEYDGLYYGMSNIHIAIFPHSSSLHGVGTGRAPTTICIHLNEKQSVIGQTLLTG